MGAMKTVFGLALALQLSGCALIGGADVRQLKTQFPVVIYQGKKSPPSVKLQGERPSHWVTLEQISKVAARAIIVSEDWAFYQHKGYDPNQIREAIKEDIEEGKFSRGASTITQQVVKNVFLSREKTLMRKLKEVYLAVEMEKVVGKKKILEVYLNIAEWGEGIFGIRSAARHYFSKDPSELTAKEGAFLAMLLPSPIRYSQSFRAKKLTRYASKTVRSILGKMVQAGYLTSEERMEELETPLSFEKGEAETSPGADEEASAETLVDEGAEP